jgi:hypothetical protein
MNKSHTIAEKYNILSERFTNKQCTLITTLEEYTKNEDKYKKVNIIASCGHKRNDVFIHDFFNKGCGNRCNDCVKKETKDKVINKEVKTNEIEYLAYNLFKDNLHDFEVIRTNEGCIVDIIIKPKNKVFSNNELYLPIQLKSILSPLSTEFNNNNTKLYSFNGLIKDRYKNMVILLICIQEKKFWILDNDNLQTDGKISIGKTSDTYSKYRVDITNINSKFIELYDKNKSWYNTKEHFNTSNNIYQQIEKEYNILRKTKLDFITFTKPFIDMQAYDFLIGTRRVQEKVCGIRKDRPEYRCLLSRSNGYKNGKLLKKGYKLGDNDFYWFNLPDMNTFYIIPEKILYDMNKIGDDKIKMLYIPFNDTDHWLYDYKFYYDKPDKKKILNLLDKYNHNNNIILDEQKYLENLRKLIPEYVEEIEVIKEIKSCIDCMKEILDLSTRCRKCYDKYKLKTSIINSNRPSLEQINADLKELKTFVKVGLKYNVSDNCIRKWIRKYSSLNI